MKTFVHANQNKFNWIYLAANNGIYDLYKKEKTFHNHSQMFWYHPALLSFDNHATLSAFIFLNEFIQYFNSYNTHLIAKGDVKNLLKPTWKSLREVYSQAQTKEANIISHNQILILSHPHYPMKSKNLLSFTGAKLNETDKKEVISKWAQEDMELE